VAHFPSARPERRALTLLVPLFLIAAACTVAPPPPEPPLPYPPAARHRMVRIALAEWEVWGRRERTPGSVPADNTAPLAPPESEPANFPHVLAYWRALQDDEGAIARNRRRYAAALSGRAGGEALWQEPAWSAAFIAFVLRSAGVDRREFPSDAAHGTYVDALIHDAERFPALAPFVPREPQAYAPHPGDLVCADRGSHPITHWAQRAADGGRFRPMHCDIVVEAEGGFVAAVGGNVGDAVSRTRFPVNAAGYLLPQPPGNPVWFAVFENRLGRLPPWGDSSAPPPPGSARS
jgi:hypothetical protein